MVRLTVVFALALGLTGCVSKEEPGVLSDGCLINSDCASPLVCAFRRCHTQCDTVRDCPAGLECVPADRPFNVCLLPDENCRTQPCPAGLLCGADLLCRAPCSGDPGSNESCLAEQRCVNGGVCASGVFIVDGKLPASTDGGATCIRNSDCPENLVCLAGTCRRECLENRDCAPGLSCSPGTGLCVLPAPTTTVPPSWSRPCATSVDCWSGLGPPPTDGGVLASDDPRTLICGAANRCTYECTLDDQCATGHCTNFHCTSTGPVTTLPDGGTVPLAVSGPTQVASPGATVTLSGIGSSGEGALSYRWTQQEGSTVTLSANDSPTAFQTTFTAPATPQVLRFELTVTDAQNRVSTPSSTSVIIGGAPTARFTPDGGLYGGGSLVQLISSSFDDAGLAIRSHDWQLISGSVGTLSTDGGPMALLQLPNPSMGEGDVLAVVQLQVTNAVGLTSAPVQQGFTARNSSGQNWALTGSSTAVVRYGIDSLVQLSAGIDAGITTPQVSFAWACTPGIAVVGAMTSTATYAVPAVQGDSKVVTCTVTATGQAPLNPPTQTLAVNTIVNDAQPPSVVSDGITGAREGYLGHVVRFDEPLTPRSSLNGAAAYCSAPSVSSVGEVVGDSVAVLSNGIPAANATCNLSNWMISDRANNFTTVQPNAATFRPTWEGPFVSSRTASDPRPLIVSLSQLPNAQRRLFGSTEPTARPYELIARDGTSLLRFAFDPLAASSSCGTGCPLNSTTQTVAALATAVNTDNEVRTGFDGLSTFATFGSGIGLERDDTGAWSPQNSITGRLTRTRGNQGQARVVNNQLLVEQYDRASRTFVAPETVGGSTGAIDLFSVQDSVGTDGLSAGIALIHRPAGWEAWQRSGTNVWLPGTVPLDALTSVTELRSAGIDNYFVAQRSVAPYLVVTTPGSFQGSLAQNAVPTGWDVVRRGYFILYAVAELGDVRLFITGVSNGGPFVIPGPPRGSLTPPPTALDIDVACEAAWPRLALIDDAIVVTWQERCSSGGPWTVNARILR